jgi:formylglycine-generating enzyme required for sulfatase activity
MNKAFAFAAALALLCLGSFAQADVFNLGPGLTNLETVTVGDPGNAADTRYETLGHGSVSCTYNIGKYEVTAAQYCDFLNHKAKSDPHGLYNTTMSIPGIHSYGCGIERSGSSGSYTYSVAANWANRPVGHVSYWDACRFANWLSNGQGNGDTENGAYTLAGYNGDDGRSIQRNAGAVWAVTSQDEWYKAGFYKGRGTNEGYWDYATQSNTAPANQVLSPDPGNSINYDMYYNGADHFTVGNPYYRTNVGEFENSAGAYGTFDQNGNVWEWNEAVVHINTISHVAYRGLRGGSFFESDLYWFRASYHDYGEGPTREEGTYGFRVVQVVPEPSSIIALAGGLAALFGVRRRKA